jgi:hypothetical protein
VFAKQERAMTEPTATPGVPAASSGPTGAPAVPAGLPEVPPNVQKFAEEQGVAAFLPDVLALVRRIVPGRPITVHLECDPSIPDDWYITLDVTVSGMTAEQLFAAQQEWSKELVANFPTSHVHFFHFGWR